MLEKQQVSVELVGDETLDVTLESYEDFESVDIKEFYASNTNETLSEEIEVDVDGGMLYYKNRGIQIVVNLTTMEYRENTAEVED